MNGRTRQHAIDSAPAAKQKSSDEKRGLSALGRTRALTVAGHAAYLWTARQHVARSSAVTLAMLASVDERITNITYRLSEKTEVAEHLLRDTAQPFRQGVQFVAAVIGLHGGANHILGELLERLGDERALLEPLWSALAWVEHECARPAIDHLLGSTFPTLLRLGIEAAIARGIKPDAALERALDSDAETVRATALKAVGRLGVNRLRPRLSVAFDDHDDRCRFWAAWSAVRLGDRAGIPVLGQFAGKEGPFTLAACDLALRALDPHQAIRAHTRLRSIPGHDGTSIIAAGMIGDSRLASWMIDAMDSPALGRRAGAAFCLMTGCDLRRDDLDANPPLNAREEGDSGDQADLGLELFPAMIGRELDDLIWPDSAKVRRWWSAHEQAFVPGIRYIAGRPATPVELTRTLRGANQWQRAAAALEIALINPDVPLFDVTSPARWQLHAASAEMSSAGKPHE